MKRTMQRQALCRRRDRRSFWTRSASLFALGYSGARTSRRPRKSFRHKQSLARRFSRRFLRGTLMPSDACSQITTFDMLPTQACALHSLATSAF